MDVHGTIIQVTSDFFLSFSALFFIVWSVFTPEGKKKGQNQEKKYQSLDVTKLHSLAIDSFRTIFFSTPQLVQI